MTITVRHWKRASHEAGVMCFTWNMYGRMKVNGAAAMSVSSTEKMVKVAT